MVFYLLASLMFDFLLPPCTVDYSILCSIRGAELDGSGGADSSSGVVVAKQRTKGRRSIGLGWHFFSLAFAFSSGEANMVSVRLNLI